MTGEATRSAEEERIVPGTRNWEASFPDHIQRYRFALEHLPSGARVLDAGCGVGYGAAEMVDRRGARVVAVDVSEEALRLARQHFDRPGILWIRDDCQSLGQAAAHAPFDAIINFENIEHLEDPEAFLARAASMLHGAGVLIASTPNRLLLNLIRGRAPDAPSPNPYHLSELSEDEFRQLLGRYFEDVSIHYQSPAGRARLRLRLQAIAGELGVLTAVRRTLQRIRGRPRQTDASDAGSHGQRRWTISDHDNGTAWTIIAVCRHPRIPESHPRRHAHAPPEPPQRPEPPAS